MRSRAASGVVSAMNSTTRARRGRAPPRPMVERRTATIRVSGASSSAAHVPGTSPARDPRSSGARDGGRRRMGRGWSGSSRSDGTRPRRAVDPGARRAPRRPPADGPPSARLGAGARPQPPPEAIGPTLDERVGRTQTATAMRWYAERGLDSRASSIGPMNVNPGAVHSTASQASSPERGRVAQGSSERTWLASRRLRRPGEAKPRSSPSQTASAPGLGAVDRRPRDRHRSSTATRTSSPNRDLAGRRGGRP